MEFVAIARNKNTNFIITSSSYGTKQEALKTAKYYRSIGYNSNCVKYSKFLDLLDQDRKEYADHVKRQVTYIYC